MYSILIGIYVLISLGLILVVLMQSSKGEGLAGAFGGTALSGAVFGGRGAATFLSKATSILAIAFMIFCLVLAFISPARKSMQQESAVKKQLSGEQALPGGESTVLPGEEATPSGDITLPPAPAGDKKPTEGDKQGQ